MNVFGQIIINSLVLGSIYVLIALGFSLIYNSTKFFNLAHGITALAGAYITFLVCVKLGFNLYIGIILGIFCAGILGFLQDRFIYRYLRQKKASGLVQLIASLGAFTVLQSLLAIIFSSQFQTLSNLIGNQKIYTILNGSITQIQVTMIACAVLVFLSLKLFLNKTKVGHAVMAISDDEEVAKIVGINTNKIIGLVFFIGSCIAGLAGILYGLDTGIEPNMGLVFLLYSAMAAIIGGIKNINGVVLGCYFLAFVENFGIWQINGEWRGTIAFGLLLLFLIFRPGGIIRE